MYLCIFYLGNVIMSLADKSRSGTTRHIPYRDSTLTFLLRDSIGGNSLTCIIACISPSNDSFAETLSTLQFAARAKSIKNNAIINSNQTASISALQAEILRLQAEVAMNQQQAVTNNRRASMSMQPPTHTLHHRTPYKTPRKHQSNGLLSIDEYGTVIDYEVLHEQSLQRESQWNEQVIQLQSEVKQLNGIVSTHDSKQQSHNTIIKIRDDTIKRLEQQLNAYTNNKSNAFIQESTLRERLRLQDIELAELRKQSNDNPIIQQQKLSIDKLQLQNNELQSALFIANNQRSSNTDVTPMKRQRIDSSVRQHSMNYQLTKKLVQLEKLNIRIQSELDNIQIKYDKQYTEQINALNQTIQQQTQQLSEYQESTQLDAKVRVELFARIRTAEQLLLQCKLQSQHELEQLNERYELMVHRDTNDQQTIEQLHQQLSHSINESHTLQSSITQLQHDKHTDQTQINQLNQSLTATKQQLAELQSSNTIAADELNNVVTQLKYTNQQIDILQSELIESQQKLQQKQIDYDTIQHEQSEWTEKYTQLTIEHEKQYFALTVAQEDIETYIETHQYNEHQLQQLNTQLSQKSDELIAVQNQLEDALARIDELTNSPIEHTLNEQINELQQHSVVHTNTIQELNNKVNQLEQDKHACEEQISDLTQVNNEFQQNLTALHCNESQLQSQITSLQGDIMSYQAQLSEVNVELEQVRAAIEISESEADERAVQYAESLDSMNDNLRHADLNTQNTRHELQGMIDTLYQRVSDMNVEHELVQQSYDTLQHQYNTLQQQNTLDLQQLHLMKQQKIVLEQSLSAINLLASSLSHTDHPDNVIENNDVGAIEYKLNILINEKHNLQQTLLLAETELSSAKSTLSAAHELVDAVTKQRDSQHDTLTLEITELQHNLTELTDQYNNVTQQLQQAENDKTEYIQQINTLQVTVSEQSDLIDAIQLELTQSTDSTTLLEEQLLSANTELQSSMNDKQQWINELESAHQAEHNALHKLQQLRVEHSKLQDELCVLQSDLLQANNRNSTLNEQVSGLIGHQNTKQKIHYVSSLKSENDILQQTVHKLELQAQKLRAQLLRVSGSDPAQIDVQRYNSDIKDVLQQAEKEAQQELNKLNERNQLQLQLDALVQSILPLSTLVDLSITNNNNATIPNGKRSADETNDNVLNDRTNKRVKTDTSDIKISAARSKSNINGVTSGGTSAGDITVQHSIAILNSMTDKYKSTQNDVISKEYEIQSLQQQLALMTKKQQLIIQQNLINQRSFQNELDTSVAYTDDNFGME